MRKRKRCRFCRRLFAPHPQTYRRQRACSRPACRKQRRRHTQENYRKKNPFPNDTRRRKLSDWRKAHGASYMRRYRQRHPAYVRKNRHDQHRRDRKKNILVKQDQWSPVRIGKLMQIRFLDDSCKTRLVRLTSPG